MAACLGSERCPQASTREIMRLLQIGLRASINPQVSTVFLVGRTWPRSHATSEEERAGGRLQHLVWGSVIFKRLPQSIIGKMDRPRKLRPTRRAEVRMLGSWRSLAIGLRSPNVLGLKTSGLQPRNQDWHV